MADIWVISDHHWNHKNIIKYGDRPFSSLEEMNWSMVESWNSVVKPGDKVYHLGDVYMDASKEYIENIFQHLNGHKRLILGNHDNGKDQILQRFFEKIVLWRDFKDFGLVLTHIPLHPGSIKEGRVNVHGHIHQKESPVGPYICACVEQPHVNYVPIHIEELSKMGKKL